MRTGDSVDACRRSNPRLFAAVFFLSPLIASIAPRATPATMALMAVALILAALRRGLSWRELIKPTAALFGCLAFSLYVLVNASWAWNPSAGFAKAFLLLGMILLVFAATTAASRLDERRLHLAARVFVLGAALGALYVLVELLTDHAITRFVMDVLPAIRPTKRIRVVHGEVTYLGLNTLNQNVTLLMLHLWPSILMLVALARAQRRALLITLFVVISAVAILLSQHASSQVALFGSAFAFLVAWWWRRLAISALVAIWCLAFAAALPLSFAAYDAGLHLSESLPLSFKARIIIWEYTAERTLEHPWLGVGVRSTREEDNAHISQTPSHDQSKGFVARRWRYTGHHGHSLFMQTWYELGAVGAVLLAVAGALVVLRTTALPKEAQPFAAATFASFAIIAAFSWGIWQTWWMCAAALAAIYLCLGAGLNAAAPQRPD